MNQRVALYSHHPVLIRGSGHRAELAEFERDLIHTPTSGGRERAKARGVQMGATALTRHQREEARDALRMAGATHPDMARGFNVRQAAISKATVMRFSLRGAK
jgi:DNA invertase Pin-like site-specific DNA recombinase